MKIRLCDNGFIASHAISTEVVLIQDFVSLWYEIINEIKPQEFPDKEEFLRKWTSI